MVLLGVTLCYKVLYGVTWCYTVLQGVTGCYTVLDGVTQCCIVFRTVDVASGPFQSVPFIIYSQLLFPREPLEFVHFIANFTHGVVVSCYCVSPVQHLAFCLCRLSFSALLLNR